MQRNLGWTELRNGDLRIDQEVRRHRPRHMANPDVRHGRHGAGADGGTALTGRGARAALRGPSQFIVPKGKSVQKIVERRLPGIGVASRKLLCEALGRTVHLHLTAKAESPNDRLLAGEFLR
eukprot:6027703-Prymnesium_polylepis.2